MILNNYGIHHHCPSKILKLYKNKCLRGSRSLDLGGEVGKGYKIFGPDGHAFDRRWMILYREGENNCSISVTIFGYNITQSYRCNTEHQVVLLQKPQKQSLEVFCKKMSFKNFACNFINKRFQHRCFIVKLAKFLKTSILKNICERLLLQNITEKNNSSISITKLLGLYNYYYNL